MMRLSLLCLVAGVAVVSAIDFKAVKPQVTYTDDLRLVQQATETMRQNLVVEQPSVDDPRFHYLLMAGVIDLAGKRMANSRLFPAEEYQNALQQDLSKVYRDLVNTSVLLNEDATNVEEALEPLNQLVDTYCEELDDKDCDIVLELQLQKQQSNTELRKAVDVLRAARAVADSYLYVQEELVNSANSRSGLGYVLNNVELLSVLANQHANVLRALNTDVSW